MVELAFAHQRSAAALNRTFLFREKFDALTLDSPTDRKWNPFGAERVNKREHFCI